MRIFAIISLVLLSTVFSCKEKESTSESNPEVETAKNEPKRNYKTYCNPIDIDYSYMSHYRAKNK
ncbi:MAG: hypothetical protein KDD20_09705, partial [Mangrovimonas sp.]|nr:hypothetical protein [Mangrovimonas sp.]